MSTPPAAPDRVAIALSREEVLYLSQLLNLSPLPGFSTHWLSDAMPPITPEEIDRQMTVAGLGLVARGLITIHLDPPKPPRVEVNLAIAALLRGCAVRQDSLFISTVSARRGQFSANLHWTGQFGVAHTGPFPGVHLFEAIESQGKYRAAASQILHIETPSPPANLPEGMIQASSLLDARDLTLKGDTPRVIELLVQGGLPFSLSQALGGVMGNPETVFASVLVWHALAADQSSMKFMSVITSPQLCFMVTADNVLPERVTIRAASTDDILTWLHTAPNV